MTSKYADEGTAAHTLAERCLKDGSNAGDHVGSSITIQHYRHAKLGASSAHRWLVCTASVLAQGEDTTPVGPGTTWEVTDEMADAVQLYLDEVRKTLRDLPNSVLYVEQSFELFDLHPEMAGSCDAVVIQPMGKIRVFDFKYGAGKAVDAKDNAQMKFYGCGALRSAWDAETLELTIVQPRAFHKAGPIRDWQVPPAEVVSWAQTHLKAKAAEAFSDKARFVAGDHCHWCRYAPNCAAARTKVTDVAMTVFSPINDASRSPTLQPAANLNDEQLGRVLDFADMVATWVKSVEEEAYKRATSGGSVLGYKLVKGKGGNRKWADENIARKTIPPGIEFYEKSAKSPAQIEKDLKAKKIKLDLSSLTTQADGKPTLVPATDSRPAISALPFTPIADSDFLG